MRSLASIAVAWTVACSGVAEHPATPGPGATGCTFADVELDDVVRANRCTATGVPSPPADPSTLAVEVAQGITLHAGEQTSVELVATNITASVRRLDLDVRCGQPSDWTEVAIVHVHPRDSTAPPDAPGTTIRIGDDERADTVFHNYACFGGRACSSTYTRIWLVPGGVLRVRVPIAARVIDECEDRSSPLAAGRYRVRFDAHLLGRTLSSPLQILPAVY